MKNVIILILCLIYIANVSKGNDKIKPLSDKQIINQIEINRPSKGAKIPSDIKTRLGATHVA